MIKKEWKINDKNKTKPLIERLLSVRGISKQDSNEFLNPLDIKLIHPNAFCDMQKSVDRIEKAIKENEKILVYGDFDADGITSTSLLVRLFRHLGADIDYYIPSRELDGHGLNSKTLVKLMVSVKPKLIITVDCGISNIDEVKFINSFKKDVIITDHHESGNELPDAYAILNPKAPNALDEKLTAKEINYLSCLAGVGVAFKLAQGILERFKKLEFLSSLLPYVTVGTIADVVPLIGENRYYVQRGLQLISQGKHYGLKRLLESAGYNNVDENLTADKIAFGVAPRINACGRLDSVKDAVNLLLSDNPKEIEVSMMALNNYNKIRQELESKIFAEADSMASKSKDNILVLYKKDWHIGVIGIAASGLVEKYGKPTFLMTYSEDTNQIRCSARGIEGYSNLNLHDIISTISDKLDGFGGHALAAGLYFSPDKHSFEEIKEGLIKAYNEQMQGEKPIPVINIDAEIEPENVTEDLINDISRLEPYGASNPAPLFVINDFKLVAKKLMGSTGNHLRLTVNKNGLEFNAIWWSHGDIELKKDDVLDIAFSPQINVFNGNTSIQLIIKDVHSDCIVEQDNSKVILYDDRKKSDILDKVNDYLKKTQYDFCTFAENPAIINALKPYPEITKRIVNRNSLMQKDGIMFFDYPPTIELMHNIIEKVSPERVHFMAYDADNIEKFDYIKMLSGMIKYACNSKDGIFDLNSSSCFLGVTPNIIETLLELFEDYGSIKISDREENYIKIEYLKPMLVDIPNDNENYSLFKSLLKEITDTRKTFMSENLENINV